MRAYLDPKNDLVFHLLFARPESKRCLIALLSSVLRPPVPIADLEVLNPDIPAEQLGKKGIVLDILVRLADGTLADVEMQVRRRTGFPKRILFYWARAFTSQLDRGEEYRELRPASVVVFTEFQETAAARLHSTYRLLEIHDYQEFSRDLELHLVELPKLGKLSEADLRGEADLARWARFLAARTDEELVEASKEDQMIGAAKNILEHLSADPKVRQMIRMREEGEFLYRVDLTEERKAGRAEGEAEGKREVLLLLLDRAEISLTPEQREAVGSCNDVSRLNRWIELALADNFEDLFPPES